MKKYLKPFLFIAIAALVVAVMYFINLPIPLPPPPEDVQNATQSFAMINQRCDSLGKKKWNKAEYLSIKNSIATNSAGSASISSNEAEILKNTLEQKYAESMVKSYDEWKKSLGATNIEEVYTQMISQANISGCKYILDNSMNVIKKYKTALGIPQLVSDFQNNELVPFTEERYNEIMTIIVDCCNNSPVASFKIIQDIASTQREKLTSFREYAKKFNDLIATLNNTDPQKINTKFYEFCTDGPKPNPKTWDYPYYLNYLKTHSLCKFN